MEQWLLERLFGAKDQPKPRFAFQGTVNWMRALSILVENSLFNDRNIKKHYSKVQRRNTNRDADTVVFENILMALHCVSGLSTVNSNISNQYDVVRSQIISWYYTIYYSSSAMVTAASGATPETHARTAKVWQKDIVEKGLVVIPFDLSLTTLVETDVKKRISGLRGHNKYDLNNKPTNKKEAWGAVCSYLRGTADYKKSEIEERVKTSKEFKKLAVDNFRTKKARILRDKKLSKAVVNFMTQAFRYRGKANYRDSIYLSYGDNRNEEIKEFTKDLENVSKKFLRMACFYLERRIEKGMWNRFVEDLEQNIRLKEGLELLRV